MRALASATIYIYLIYFIGTIIYVSPFRNESSFVEKTRNFYSTVFAQTWEFFVPPPKSNLKIYYCFYSVKETERECYDVLGPILEQKRLNAPNNKKEQILDYVLTSNFVLTQNLFKKQWEVRGGAEDSTAVIEAKHYVDSVFLSFSPSKTFYNYHQIVFKDIKKNQPEYTADSFNISFQYEELIPFEKRDILLTDTVSNFTRDVPFYTSPKFSINVTE